MGLSSDFRKHAAHSALTEVINSSCHAVSFIMSGRVSDIYDSSSRSSLALHQVFFFSFRTHLRAVFRVPFNIKFNYSDPLM